MNSAAATLNWAIRCGVREFVVCPGARNSAWVKVLTSQNHIRTYFHFEEREAAFFALGRSLGNSKSPVAVLTTSGTACAELLPAIMEAYYSGVPLIAMTADRPKHFRGTGAPQSANQAGLFGIYAPTVLDLADPFDLPKARPFTMPAHINQCFEEPAWDSLNAERLEEIPLIDLNRLPESNFDVSELMRKSRRPLVLLGGSDRSMAQALEQISPDIPIVAEACSLNSIPRSRNPQLLYFLGQSFKRIQSHYPFDLLIRVGAVPTARLWRDMEFNDIPVINVSELPWSGLGRKGVFQAHGGSLNMAQSSVSLNSLVEEEARWKTRFGVLCEKYPQSEQALYLGLAQASTVFHRIFLGNSLPIRQFSQARFSFEMQRKEPQYFAARGLNGIDGQLSTFFGLIDSDKRALAVLGDLTSLYGASAPWILKELPKISADLVVMNNFGGMIFNAMYGKTPLENRHSLKFHKWAEMWGASYKALETFTDFHQIEKNVPSGFRVWEAIPCANQTQEFSNEWKQTSP